MGLEKREERPYSPRAPAAARSPICNRQASAPKASRGPGENPGILRGSSPRLYPPSLCLKRKSLQKPTFALVTSKSPYRRWTATVIGWFEQNAGARPSGAYIGRHKQVSLPALGHGHGGASVITAKVFRSCEVCQHELLARHERQRVPSARAADVTAEARRGVDVVLVLGP